MKTLMTILSIICAPAFAGNMETVATNYSVDMVGSPDTRGSCCWGDHGFQAWEMEFIPDQNIPGGIIQIEEIHGDMLSWPTNKGQAPAIIPEGRFIGVSVALHRSDRWNSQDYCAFCNRDCMLYMQDALSSKQPVSRITYDIVDMGYRLGPDNTLRIIVAQWLNDAGVMVHMEPTLTIKYRTVSPHERASRPGTGESLSNGKDR